MLGYLILLFIAVPIVELALLIKVGQYIGVLNTIIIVVGTGVAGAFLAKREGLKTLYGIRQDLDLGMLPSEHLIDGFFIFCGGLLLLTPGLITDILGFFFLIPYTRSLVKAWLKIRFKNMIDKGEVTFFTPFRY
jgi:UPF0716 protein FxsA